MAFLKGRINIGFCSSSREDDFVRIELIDESSHVHFAEIRMTAEDFARAMFGRGEIRMAFELRGLKNVGKMHQNKTELVPFTDKIKAHMVERNATSADIKAMLAPFEVDGWIGSGHDIFNSHNIRGRGKDAKVEVGFHRYVEPGPAPMKGTFGDEEWNEGRGIS